MVRLVWLVVLLGGGCTLGGGLSVGYRASRPTVGWEAGVGITNLDDGRSSGSGGVAAGQSWRDGHPFTYGAVTGQLIRFDEGDEVFYGAGGTIGGGGDGEGARLLVGADPFVGRVTGDGCGTQRVVMLSLGARAIGNDLEIYLAPRFAVIGNICSH